MAKLTIIAGTAGSGKTSKARSLVEEDPTLTVVDEAHHPKNWERVMNYVLQGRDVVAVFTVPDYVDVINVR